MRAGDRFEGGGRLGADGVRGNGGRGKSRGSCYGVLVNHSLGVGEPEAVSGIPGSGVGERGEERQSFGRVARPLEEAGGGVEVGVEIGAAVTGAGKQDEAMEDLKRGSKVVEVETSLGERQGVWGSKFMLLELLLEEVFDQESVGGFISCGAKLAGCGCDELERGDGGRVCGEVCEKRGDAGLVGGQQNASLLDGILLAFGIGDGVEQRLGFSVLFLLDEVGEEAEPCPREVAG